MERSVLERVVFEPAEYVFKDGEEGNSAYVLQDGLIEIVKGSGDDEVILGTIDKGGIFGEMALIDDEPQMASARAGDPRTVIVIDRQMFRNKLAKSDPFVRGLLGIFTKNLRSMAGASFDD